MAHESHIWLPKYQDVGLELPKPTFKGRFKLIAGKANGEERVVADWQDNLILDAGLDRIAVSGNNYVVNGVAVGSSNTTPAINQTGLISLVAWTTTASSIAAPAEVINTSSPYQSTYYWRWRFSAGAAAGNLAEVGVGWGSTTMFSRALIKDGSGNPTTITILSDEYLDVIYGLTVYPPLTDSSYSISISGTSYSCITRAARAGQTTGLRWKSGGAYFYSNSMANFSSTLFRTYTGDIGAITSLPSGTVAPSTSANTITVTYNTYTAGSFSRGITTVANLNDCNMDIKSIQTGFVGIIDGIYGANACFQTSFDPVIPKTSSKILTLNYSLSWGRYTP